MRKKLLALALSMSMVFGLAGCGNNGSDDSVGGKDSKSESTNVSGKTEEKEINGIKYPFDERVIVNNIIQSIK